jgi:hypothetical protein
MWQWQSRPEEVTLGFAVRLTVVILVIGGVTPAKNVRVSEPMVIDPTQSVWPVTEDIVTLHRPVVPDGQEQIVGEAVKVPSNNEAATFVTLYAPGTK